MSKNKWIRKDDKVVVIAGNDKGKSGTVLARKGNRVIIQGINIRKKHMKRTQESQSAQIVSMEKPIDISNVALCDANDAIIKLHTKLTNDKKTRELVYKKNNKNTVFRSVKKRTQK